MELIVINSIKCHVLLYPKVRTFISIDLQDVNFALFVLSPLLIIYM